MAGPDDPVCGGFYLGAITDEMVDRAADAIRRVEGSVSTEVWVARDWFLVAARAALEAALPDALTNPRKEQNG